MPRRVLAPAGAPIRPGDLARWVSVLATPGVESALERTIAERMGVGMCRVVSTGRAGMTLIARAVGRMTSRREIVIPSYTCYSVAASIVKAGLRPRIADIVPETLDYDYERLERSDLGDAAAIVATNLYGLPNDMPRLRRVAEAFGMRVIDDAAQALGARIAGRPCGTAGDVGLYSFDKGKNVSAIDGGAIVSSSAPMAAALAEETSALESGGAPAVADALVKLAAYAALLPPRMYWIPAGLPQLGLGATVYTTAFPIRRPARVLAALALTMLRRLDEFTAARRANAHGLMSRLESIPGVTLISPAPDAEPVYLRLPLILPSRGARDAAIAALVRAGVGATGSYPASIADIPQLRGIAAGLDSEAAGGRAVAERILTLPTHPYVTAGDHTRVEAVLRGVLLGGPAVVPMPAIVHQS